MTWDAVGAIAEMLAAVGVIISFFYLAAQIRQNTAQLSQNAQSLKVSGVHALHAAGLESRAQIAAQPDVYLSGLRDPSSLTPEQRLVFNMQIENVIMNARLMFFQHREWATDPGLWAFQASQITWLARQPGGRQALERFADDSSAFGAELSRLLAEASPAA
jgi:hypothetical protein